MKKCLKAVSTDNLVFEILDNLPDPGEPPGNSDGKNPGTRAKSRHKTPGVAQGGILVLGTD